MAERVVRAIDDAEDRVFGVVERIDGRYWATVFFLGLLGYTALMIAEALTYSNVAALFPLVIGVPLVGLIIVHVSVLLFGERLGLESVDLFESVQELDTEEEEEVPVVVQYEREFEMVLWTAVSVIVVWLVGHLLGLLVFVFGFIYINERDLKRAAIATGITFAFSFLLFKTLLGAVLWQGVTGVGVVFS